VERSTLIWVCPKPATRALERFVGAVLHELVNPEMQTTGASVAVICRPPISASRFPARARNDRGGGRANSSEETDAETGMDRLIVPRRSPPSYF